MWGTQIVDHQKSNGIDLECIISGKTPMIIIRNFYSQELCRAAVDKIMTLNNAAIQNENPRHMGPFLMAYTTSKKKYFEDAIRAKITLGEIFSDIQNPIPCIYETAGNALPEYSVSLAREYQNDYSQAIIRIHKKKSSVLIHKDNVRYEGKEYAVSKIDHQISCVLHLQESESGGVLVMYDKQWKRADERFRNVDFGYSPNLVKSACHCRAPDIESGDLVIINPEYYHKVTTITGNTPRVTLGMFLGIYERDRKIVAWA